MIVREGRCYPPQYFSFELHRISLHKSPTVKDLISTVSIDLTVSHFCGHLFSILLLKMKRHFAILVAAIASVKSVFGLSKSVGNTSLATIPSLRPPFPNLTMAQRSTVDESSSKGKASQPPTTDGSQFRPTSLTVASHNWPSVILAANRTIYLPAPFPVGPNTRNTKVTTRNQSSKSSAPAGAKSSSKAGLHMTTTSEQTSSSRHDRQSSGSLKSTKGTPARRSAESISTSSSEWAFLRKMSSMEKPTSTLSSSTTQTMTTIKPSQSSVTEAFDASFTQPYSVSFRGSTFQYTRATFSDLASITAATTITTPIVEFNHDDSQSTSTTGNFIVGPGGVW